MNLIAKVSWLQKMINYLYKKATGAVQTVNGTAPDANGNVVVSGGAGTLQTVTDGAGNNITTNAMLLTGFDQFSTDIDGMILADTAIIQVDSTAPGNVRNSISLGLNETAVTYRDIAILSLSNLAGASAIASFKDPNGNPITVSGADAVKPTQFVTLQQMPQFVGGVHTFNSDGLTDTFTIPHGLTTVTSHYVTRNSDPNGNLIATHITGANIVVSFVAGAPLVGLTIVVNWGASGTI